jgi:hypothetical protein
VLPDTENRLALPQNLTEVPPPAPSALSGNLTAEPEGDLPINPTVTIPDVQRDTQHEGTRRKLPPPPPHEDRPEHYKKRSPSAKNASPVKNPPAQPGPPQSGQPVKIEPERQEAQKAESIGSSPSPVCLIEPLNYAADPAGLIKNADKNAGSKTALRGNRNEVRPVALSPAAIVYLFSDQFLPPKKMRQLKREMHNFFVVERESLASLMLVQAMLSLRRRGSIKLSPISAIVPVLRRKLEIREDEKFVLQLVNGSVKPLDGIERQILESLGNLNTASLRTVCEAFIDSAERSERAVAAAEMLNDTMAEELAELFLIERGIKSGKMPLDLGESDRSYKANDDEIGRYFSQLDDIKELISSVKAEPPVIVGTSRVPIFEYLFDYYRDLFIQNSSELAQRVRTKV